LKQNKLSKGLKSSNKSSIFHSLAAGIEVTETYHLVFASISNRLPDSRFSEKVCRI